MTEIKPGTPLPWQSHGSHIYGPEREMIAQVIVDGPLMADRDYIVHTANAYPSLLNGLREAREALEAMMDAWFDYHDAHSLTQSVTGRADNAFDKALAARDHLDTLLAQEGEG